MKNIPIRNGDINFHPVNKIEGEIVEHKGEFIVGYGETTGHKHRLSVKNKDNLIIRKDTFGNYYFELKEDGILTHEEHKQITIPAGLYRKFQEEEVDHFASSVVRKVVD